MNKVTEYGYNVDGKLVTLTARNDVTGDQVTRWEYGTSLEDSGVASFELLRAKVYPDDDGEGSGEVSYAYNQFGELAGQRDQNGTVHLYDYDRLGRLVHDRVTALGTNVDGTVRRISRSYEVRGLLARVTSASDPAPEAGSAVNEVRLQYNRFGQVSADFQSHFGAVDATGGTTPWVSYTYADGSSNSIRPLGVTYPNGRVLAYGYGAEGSVDRLRGRVHEIWDGEEGGGSSGSSSSSSSGGEATLLARYIHRGVKSTVRVEYAEPGLELTYLKQGSEPVGDAGDQYTGLDRFGRIIDIRWLKSATGEEVDRFQYQFDEAGNRRERRNLTAPARDWDEHYAYDGLYQLAGLERGNFEGSAPEVAWEEEFGYDPTGNWQQYVTRVGGTTTLDQARSHNEANEITAITSPASSVGYDRAGNMTTLPKVGAWTTAQALTWDAWNRLVQVQEGSATVARYAYDGLTRRIWKSDSPAALGRRREFFYSDKWQVLEERLEGGSGSSSFDFGSGSGSGSFGRAERQFVWGLRYLDDLILRDRFAGGSSGGGSASTSGSGSRDGESSARLYATHDQWHVTAVAGEEGTIRERYAYEAFGQSIVLTPGYTVRATGSLFNWETRYGAYRYDEDTGLYCVRYRYLHPGLGRWLSRDPAGEESGINLFAYTENRPTQSVDSKGLRPAFETEKQEQQYQDYLNLPCCNGVRYEPDEKCCINDKLIETLSLWTCTRPVASPPFAGLLFNHQYVCCEGPNQKCFGHQNNDLKKGDRIPEEQILTGSCEEKKVCPANKKAHCDAPTSPRDAGTFKWNCQDWANWDGE